MARKRLKSRRPTAFCLVFSLDLLGQILGRLPVKTLLQFRCVSKEWRSLIDSSEFAYLHFTLYNNTRQNPPLFLMEHGCDELSCSIRCSDTFREICQFHFPKDFGRLYPVGYANGFVLCAKLENHLKVASFVMWNPSTRKSTEIPYPRRIFIGNIKVILLDTATGGSNNNDYKLVVTPIIHPSWHTGNGHSARVPSTVLIEVYSFNTASWRTCSTDAKYVSDLEFFRRAIVPLNGALHWIGANPMNEPCIVVFDVQNDALRYFSLPAVIQDIQGVKLHIRDESLVLVKREDKGYHIWVMEHYAVDESWVNRIQIDTEYEAYFLHLRSNGKFFFSSERGMEVFDVESRKIKNLAKSHRCIRVVMDTFVETLASLPGGYKESKESSREKATLL